MRAIIRAASVLLLMSLLLFGTSLATISYEIDATVGGNEWRLARATQNLSFSLDGSVIGSGNFSRYSKMNNNAGIKSKEQSSAVKGGTFPWMKRRAFKPLRVPL